MYINWNNRLLLVVLILTIFTSSKSQTSDKLKVDTLELEKVIGLVIANNPVLKQSGEIINASDLAIKLAESAWLPMVDANGSYTRLAPIPAFDIPQFGHIQMLPDNGMNFSVEVHQQIYDFGKTAKNIEIQKLNKEIAGLSAEQVKEKLSLATAGIFYTLFYLQSSRGILEAHINALTKHMQNVENRQKTGSATQYEILSTKVKLSEAETRLFEIQSAFRIQLSHLSAITNTSFSQVIVKADTITNNPGLSVDTSTSYAISHRDDLLLLTRKKASQELNYQLTNLQEHPTLNLFGSGGYKNGYLPEIETLKLNYVVGVSLKVPIFEGNRKNTRLKISQCSLNQTDYEITHAQLAARDEVNENIEQLNLTKQKIMQATMQSQLAQEAYNHAEVNFREGAITNLDLIFATDMLSETELQLIKNKVDYKFNLLKLKVSMGERIY